MEEKKYTLPKQDSFNLKHIFECGQCFRWNKEPDSSYTGVILDRVINIKEDNDYYIIESNNYDNIEKILCDYFNLNYDYGSVKNKLSKIDNNLKESIEYGYGIRILNQDIWECTISFIISANNNIPRIKKIIESISKKYGNEIKFREKSYYTFPTCKQLSKASVQDLRNLGLGFRDIRVFNSCKMILDKEVDLY